MSADGTPKPHRIICDEAFISSLKLADAIFVDQFRSGLRQTKLGKPQILNRLGIDLKQLTQYATGKEIPSETEQERLLAVFQDPSSNYKSRDLETYGELVGFYLRELELDQGKAAETLRMGRNTWTAPLTSDEFAAR